MESRLTYGNAVLKEAAEEQKKACKEAEEARRARRDIDDALSRGPGYDWAAVARRAAGTKDLPAAECAALLDQAAPSAGAEGEADFYARCRSRARVTAVYLAYREGPRAEELQQLRDSYLAAGVLEGDGNKAAVAWCGPNESAACIESLQAVRGALSAERVKAAAALDERTHACRAARDALAELEGTSTRVRLADRLRAGRRARCVTAYCWGGPDNMRNAIEPVVDLPISMYWALGGGSLARHINSAELRVGVLAGVRYWFLDDRASIAVLLAKPSLTNDDPVYVEGTGTTLPSSAVRRPFPTLALGLFGDILLVTASYDQLRNTTGLPGFRHDEVLSRSITIGLSIAPFTAIRNAAAGVNATPGTSTSIGSSTETKETGK